MKFRVLGCFGGELPGYRLPGFLVDDVLLLDAGTIGQVLSVNEQARIREVLISHYHLDHTGALPFFMVNIFGLIESPVGIHALDPVVEGLRKYLLNDQIWPDFSQLPAQKPTMRFQPLEENTPVQVGSHTVIPFRVNHTVPTSGFLVHDGKKALAYTSDMGPSPQAWDFLNRYVGDCLGPPLRAVITEVSFPNHLQNIADISGHLTPSTLKTDLDQFASADIPVYLFHIKPQFEEKIHAEVLAQIRRPVTFLEQDKTYELSD